MTAVDLAALRAQRFSRWEHVRMNDGEMSLVEVDATPEVMALVEAVEALNAAGILFGQILSEITAYATGGQGPILALEGIEEHATQGCSDLATALAPFRQEQP